MANYTFRGGVHPKGGKELSMNKYIEKLNAGKELVYPLSQHIGAPANPIVQKGDKVLVGQKIAEANGFVSSNIFSSVSGTVKSIEPRRVVTGDMVMSIIVENDEQYQTVKYEPMRNWREASRDEILDRIQEAGIVGMGGAGFPTHVKLSPKNPDKIDYVIANCAECEPYLTSDYRRMIEEPEKLIEGLSIILSLFPKAHGILGIEDNKPMAIKKLKQLTHDNHLFTIKKLITKYPQGAERALIYATTGRKLNSTMLPADVGCVVNNVDTIIAIYHAVVEGRPLIERIVTVTGDAVTNPKNYKIPIGMSYQELLDANGGFKVQPEKIICGGPMMGFAMFGLDVPTTKTSTALLAFAEDEVAKAEPGPCIKCGMCVQGCPSGVLCNQLAMAASRGDKEAFVKLGGMECCECGSCSYSCPAKRPLTQTIKSMRKEILADRRKK